MIKQKFSSLLDFSDYIYELAKDEFKTVTVALCYEDAAELIGCFMLHDDIIIGNTNKNEISHDYNQVFYITLDADLILNIMTSNQSVYDKATDVYLTFDSDVFFCEEDSNLESTFQNIYGNRCEFIIDNYNYTDECGNCCGDCSNCQYKESSETIANEIELIDYIYNHIDET